MERLKASSRLVWPWVVLVLVVSHLIVSAFIWGFRFEHYLGNVLFLIPAWWGGRGRTFSILCLPLWLTGTTYEFSKYLMFLQQYSEVHIRDIYELEMALFGVDTSQGRVLLSEWFAEHNHPILDFICGGTYMVYLYEAIFLPMLFVFIDRRRQPRMAWGFFVCQTIGLVVFVLFPVAPPWYVAQYGFVADFSVTPQPAGTIRFDQLTGWNYFQNFYKLNATVFGAMPSLHVGYTLAVALGTLGKSRWWVGSTFAFTALVAFSAVYLQHHYLLDVLGGVLVAVLAYLIVIYVENRRRWAWNWPTIRDIMLARDPAGNASTPGPAADPDRPAGELAGEAR